MHQGHDGLSVADFENQAIGGSQEQGFATHAAERLSLHPRIKSSINFELFEYPCHFTGKSMTDSRKFPFEKCERINRFGTDAVQDSQCHIASGDVARMSRIIARQPWATSTARSGM